MTLKSYQRKWQQLEEKAENYSFQPPQFRHKMTPVRQITPNSLILISIHLIEILCGLCIYFLLHVIRKFYFLF